MNLTLKIIFIPAVFFEMERDDCHRNLKDNRIQKIPVVNEEGCCGIASQADFALQKVEESQQQVELGHVQFVACR